jgi:2-iminoacetate synthase ThiH
LNVRKKNRPGEGEDYIKLSFVICTTHCKLCGYNKNADINKEYEMGENEEGIKEMINAYTFIRGILRGRYNYNTGISIRPTANRF